MNFFASASNIRVVKTRRVRWMGHVPWVLEKRRAYGIIVGNLSDRDLGRLGLYIVG
jgi:hypothetical protein